MTDIKIYAGSMTFVSGCPFPAWLVVEVTSAADQSNVRLMYLQRQQLQEDHGTLQVSEGSAHLHLPSYRSVGTAEKFEGEAERLEFHQKCGWNPDVCLKVRQMNVKQLPPITCVGELHKAFMDHHEEYIKSLSGASDMKIQGQLPMQACGVLRYFATMWYREHNTTSNTKNSPARYTALALLNGDVMLEILKFIGPQAMLTYDCKVSWGTGGGGGPSLRLVEFVGDYAMAIHLGVTAEDVFVTHPKCSHHRLEWKDNNDATRNTKPHRANVTFSDDMKTFKGDCQFPFEGPLGYTGELASNHHVFHSKSKTNCSMQ